MRSETEILSIAKTAMSMDYKPNDNLDDYYPSMDDFDRLGVENADGEKDYSEHEIAFLVWSQQSSEIKSLNSEQLECMEYGSQLLANYMHRNYKGMREKEKAREYEDLSDILASYQNKWKNRK
ncbi:hypothetical protein bpr_II300 (plasmid) [Butyrivibrio proteoclasticus B316]|uniref:Uncharacterized protein n=1 Tax=Butyrivibrio proteoclasticus (strain ATCC 51982 / DSM 14932 / B316) TaxID=515622 RepID=E0S4A5_BUTPB|nr:hypothetical protein [Butyrivibrio proteoclasticus]ADL36237.1 hypothetical protein bpr_II300 [Butyrivibrio proteoclasticus B316]